MPDADWWRADAYARDYWRCVADGEGELLNRIREIAPDVPIAVALDFHTQLTDAMISGASIITGYRT